jgi:2-polyprenyl-3-methyl-5-hydroxy-6-metoxy-1,4-benzoquinol methylase
VPLTPDILDQYAETYYLAAPDDLDIEERAQRHSIPLLLAALEDCGRVLEMGYGTGLITGELVAHAVNVEVLEGSPILARQATAEHPGLTVHHGLFETFTPAEPFDAVLCLHVLEHVDEPDRLLRQIRSWLRPGGVLVAVTPNAESLHRRLAVRMGLHARLDDLSPRDRLVGHQRVYTLDGLRSEVSDTFEVRAEFGYFVKPLANGQMLDWPETVLDGLNVMSPELPP